MAVPAAVLPRRESALRHFRETIRLAPREPLVYNSLAAIFAQQGNIDEARANYRIALRLASDAGSQHMMQSIRKQLEQLPQNGQKE